MQKHIDEIETLQLQLQKKDKIIDALKTRVKSNINSSNNSFSLFETNVTLQKEVDKQTKELKKIAIKAQQGVKAKSEFLANMSHEIRTPMNGIVGMTHLVLKTILSDQQKNYIQKIDSSSKSLLRIINDILDISKIESGKLEIQKQNFDIFEIVDSAISTLELQIKEKNIEFIVNYKLGSSRYFDGDSLRITQILRNLISNAVKFTNDGEIFICIEKISNKKVLFKVKDTGIGISKEEQEKLFQSFAQANANINRLFGGTGLGLSISKQLVELMNGSIWLESKKGIGSVFLFEIELSSLEDTDTKYQKFKGKKVLVVDDNQKWLDIYKAIFKDFDMTVDICNSGLKALKMYKEVEYDLILLNWKMPKYDAVQTLEKMRKVKDRELPTLAILSGFKDENVESLAKNVGIEMVVDKNTNPYVLNEMLSNLFLHNIKPVNKVFKKDSLEVRIKTLTGSKILLVEDNIINQEIVIGLMEDSGISIDIANNGLEAIGFFDKNSYDLILMDLQMPILDGYDATKYMRTVNKTVPIIALTANSMKEDIEKTKHIGMNDHLNKPIDVEILYKTLLKYITAKSSEIVLDEGVIDEKDNSVEADKFKYIDVDLAMGYMGNNKVLFEKILKDFYATYKNLELKNLDDEAFHIAIHTLKGLSISIGAKKLHRVTKKLNTTKDRTLIPEFDKNLKDVLDDIYKNQITTTGGVSQKKLKFDKVTKKELFTQLLEATKSNRPKKCEPIIDSIKQYNLDEDEEIIFKKVVDFYKKYKFAEIKKLLEGVEYER